ncbi:MAG: 6-bladed beta-propeller [Candidatus Aminicenantes bacterium]|nr:6-bladed beta-propeller [Candidatus Aminicenantes bacterium]
MRYFKTILIINLLLLVISCSEKSGYPLRTEIIDGVKVITNPEYPRDGQFTYQLEEELIIGEKEGDENYMFNQPQSVKASEDGSIYVLDWRDICIKAYDRQGKYQRTIGRQGQGPGEFSSGFLYFDISSDGKIYIMDCRNSCVIIMDKDGAFIHSFRLPGRLFEEMKTDKDNFIYFERTFTDEEMRKMSIHRYNSNGDEILNYGTFKIVQPVIQRRTKTSSSSTTSRLAATTVWTVDQEGKLYVGFGDKYQIGVYNPNGSLSFKFGRDYPPILSRNYDDNPLHPKYVGVFNVITRHWFFDEAGNLWIETPSKEDIEEIVYDIFSPEGIYLKRTCLKYRILHFKNGKAYSIVTTNEGFKVVKRFRMIEQGKGT